MGNHWATIFHFHKQISFYFLLCIGHFLFFFYLFISLFVLSTQPSPWRNNFACFMSLFFFVLSRCHFFFFFISLFLYLFCLPSPIRGETILLALCHLSFLFYQGVTSSSSLSLYFSLCFVCPAQSVEKQFCLLYVTFLFCFIKVSDDRYRGVLSGMCQFNFSLLLHVTISQLHFVVLF